MLINYKMMINSLSFIRWNSTHTHTHTHTHTQRERERGRERGRETERESHIYQLYITDFPSVTLEDVFMNFCSF